MEINEITYDRQRDLETINVMLRNETQKKLDAIQFSLSYHHRIGVVVQTKEDLFNFLNSEDATEEIVWEVLDLLEQSFSRGYPNYIYQFELRNGLTDTDCVELLNEAIPEGIVVNPTRQENTNIKRVGDIFHEADTLVKFKVEYERWKPNLRGNAVNQSLEIKTTFDIIFDFTCSLCYIQCGDKKLLSAIEDIMKNQVVGVFSVFCSYELKQKQVSTEFQGEYSLDKQTVIILDYVEVEVNQENHEIADYSGMAFSNSRSDKVKAVRLRGKNLLESHEVSERITNGDQIRSVRFQLRKRLRNEHYLLPTIAIEFKGPLKITINNEENTSFNTDIVRFLIKALNKSLAKVYRESETKQRLTYLIQLARTRESMYIQSILAEIVEKIDGMEVSDHDKQKFVDIIDRYRLGG